MCISNKSIVKPVFYVRRRPTASGLSFLTLLALLVSLVSIQLIVHLFPRDEILFTAQDLVDIQSESRPLRDFDVVEDGLYYDFYTSNTNQTTPRAACGRIDDRQVVKQHIRQQNTAFYTDCMDALQQARQQEVGKDYSCETPNVLFHAFWASEDELPDTAKLGMLSTVYSQQGCAKLQLWTTNHVSQKILQDALAPYGSTDYFSVKILNMTDVFAAIQENFPAIRDVLYVKRRLISDLTTNIEKDSAVTSDHSDRVRKKQTRYSDMIRVLVLAAYGGVYFDTDVLLLRSLKPLLSRDFYYRWSNKYYANTAVFHLHHKSPNAQKLVEFGLQGRFWEFDSVSRLCRTYHPKTIYNILARHGGDVELLPSAYMDPHWVFYDMRFQSINDWTFRFQGLKDWLSFFQEQPTATTTVETFFPGVFAYHWHSQYRSPIGSNSVAEVFLQRYEVIRESGRFA